MLLAIAFILFFALIAAMLAAPSSGETRVPVDPDLAPAGTRAMAAD